MASDSDALLDSSVREGENQTQWIFCFGNCAPIDSHLDDRNGKICWLPFKFFNALFRGIGQVVFANNPFSGLFIFIGLVWSSYSVGLIVLLSTTVAILTALLANQHPHTINSGLISFNSVLLASVTSSIWTPLYSESLNLKVYVFIVVGSSLSVFISNGIANILSSFKPSIPILSIPFHILVFVLFACLKPSGNEDSKLEAAITNATAMDYQYLDSPKSTDFYSWRNIQNVLLAVVYSGGQVFGVADLLSSLLVYVALLIYSPLLTLMCLLGSFIGTLLGLFLNTFPNNDVLLGVWGFNGFLTCGAICLFYVYNLASFLIGIIGAIFSTVLQLSLSSSFAASRMPVFGLPFILSTLIFLNIDSDGRYLVRVSQLTFPERHRKIHYLKPQNQNEEGDAGINILTVS